MDRRRRRRGPAPAPWAGRSPRPRVRAARRSRRGPPASGPVASRAPSQTCASCSRQTCHPAASRAAFPCSGKVTVRRRTHPDPSGSSSKRRMSSAQRSSMSDGGSKASISPSKGSPSDSRKEKWSGAPAARGPSMVVGNHPARCASSVRALHTCLSWVRQAAAVPQDRHRAGPLEGAELVVLARAHAHDSPSLPSMISRWRSSAFRWEAQRRR